MSGKGKKDESSKEPKRDRNESRHVLSWAIFIPTVVIVFISIIPVVFPALITRATSPFHASALEPDVINPFATGVLAVPLVTTSILVLAVGVLYYKRSIARGLFSKISSFDISRKQTAFAIIILLAIFSALTAGTLAKEETWVDYTGVKNAVDSWDISQWTSSFAPHFKYLILSTSLHLFGNIRIVPFITSMTLLVLTYFFTKDITQKRVAGVVSTALLLQSNVFVSYSTSASYENSWILLYLFSLYLVSKFYRASTLPYFLSIFSKPLTIAFLPASLYFIARSGLQKRSRIYCLASYGGVIIMMAVVAIILKTNFVGTTISFDSSGFWQGFSAVAVQMRFDYVVILFLLPLTVMLFFASRKGILHADSMMIFILVILLTGPLLLGLTQQTNQPYRFVSLSLFFAIGVGVLLSKRTRQQAEVSSSM